MVNSVCPLCHETISPALLKLHIQLEKSLIREMREVNPEWFSQDGVCSRCVEEYKRKHAQVCAEAREIRARAKSGDERSSYLNDGDEEITD